MQIREQPLESSCFYHIYNRGINGQSIFLKDEHFAFFLQKTKYYLLPYFEVYAYCLMSNHFHFLLRTKELNKTATVNRGKTGLHSENHMYSKQIGKLISSYTQAYNKTEHRHGPLLESPFKRLRIETENYLRNLIIYIHQNPLDLGISISNYEYSSYKAMISNRETVLEREEVLSYFDDLDNFIFCHKTLVEIEDF